MIKQVYTFGLLTAALLLTPNVAFANDDVVRQDVEQNAAAVGSGSRVNQSATQTSIQNRSGSVYGKCRGTEQSQRSDQRIVQNGVAIDGSLVDQNAETRSVQRQIVDTARRFCR